MGKDLSKSVPKGDQTFWELASIQGASLGLFVIIIGGYLSKTLGPGKAISSVIIGNLILWVIGLAVIGMAVGAKANAVENVKNYLGKIGGLLAAIVVVVSFISWYAIQLRSSISPIAHIIRGDGGVSLGVRIGASLGIFIALLSIGGIKLIKWFSVIIFPFLFFYAIYLMIVFGSFPGLDGDWGFSFSGIVTVVTALLAGMVNLPTFFRHARSFTDALLALSIMIVVTIVFQLFSILTGVSASGDLLLQRPDGLGSSVYFVLDFAFIVSSLISINIVNIYFASAGWEMVVPKITGWKEYAIAGLTGTVFFTLIQGEGPLDFFNNLATAFIANLGITLMIDFAVKVIVLHRPRSFAKGISTTCWLVGCVVSVIAQSKCPGDPSMGLIAGVLTIILLFLPILFIEETIWSVGFLSGYIKHRRLLRGMSERISVPLVDKNQSYWQLACIQIVAVGLPAVLLGGQLVQLYGAGRALSSIIFGNLILWLIGLGVVAMSSGSRSNVIETVQAYIGKLGAFFAALVVIFAYLIWYAFQARLVAVSLVDIFKSQSIAYPELGFRLCAAISIVTPLFILKGIKAIKNICIALFPFIFLYLVYLISNERMFQNVKIEWAFCGTGLIAVVVILLPGIINIPTFFRHSRSLGDSVLGLSLMTIFTMILQIFCVFSNLSSIGDVLAIGVGGFEKNILFVCNILFVLLSLICVNMVNIYFASAGWKMIAPLESEGKEYAIIGLIGTSIFILIQAIPFMGFLANLVGAFIANLGVVLLIDFMIRIIVQHRPREFEKLISLLCWGIGCAASVIIQINHPDDPSLSVIVGVVFSLFSFLPFLFIEETVWSIRFIQKH